MASPEKIVVDDLVAALIARPETFSCDEYTLNDNKTNYRFWVANGASNAGVYRPFELKFGWWEGRRFHRALKAWKVWRTASKFREVETQG